MEIRKIVRTCENTPCPSTLTVIEGQPLTEALAIEIGSWLIVIGERATPQGMTADRKDFCTTECLKAYIDPLIAEYVAAEDRQLAKMAEEGSKSSGVITLTDGE